jgi:hypothetical protein
MNKNLRTDFLTDYLGALEDGTAALFVGAGLSRSAGYVDWKGLMREIGNGLGLDVDIETDLIAIAQYHVNEWGSRHQLNQRLVQELVEKSESTINHRILADLPLSTVWTTNYDTLIEDAFTQAHKKVDVKRTQENLALTRPGRDVIVYKMHGDISLPDQAVLTKEDFELYPVTRSLFADMLKGDLISKTFLFLGYSFSDPNIDYVLSRIRSLLGQSQRQHYCVMRRPQAPHAPGADADPSERIKHEAERAKYEYELTKLNLRIADLNRYRVKALLIDEYEEITSLLQDLKHRIHRKNILVSGSAHDHVPMGQERLEKLSCQIGREIISRGYNLVSGFGLGIGSTILMGALEKLYEDRKSSVSERTILRPFPQTPPIGMDKEQFKTQHRTDMISNAGFTIFISGNKVEATSGDTVIAEGVLEEFEIAKHLGKYPIPIGATGWAAQQIWEDVRNSIDTFYPNSNVREHFEVLGDSNRTDQEIIEAIFCIIEKVIASR